ncbi:MAG: anaerobic ribonucleoside-triphosphate reductase activating protein [Lachnospiraceae bacterium]|nr:anaerobic ribonucleoside-triphosphate reductase activating protein [Lachnospiraceae bacterium]
MHYGNLKKFDIANGEGVRISLFVSGCTNRCRNCFQPQTWDFRYGKSYTEKTEQEILDFLALDYVDGLSLLGGEPMEPGNQGPLRALCRRVKEERPDKTIWCYTGCVYEKDLVPGGKNYTSDTDPLLDAIDVLVDGPFIEEEKDISLIFRGSANQRIIDMKKTRESGSVVLYPLEKTLGTI